MFKPNLNQILRKENDIKVISVIKFTALAVIFRARHANIGFYIACSALTDAW